MPFIIQKNIFLLKSIGLGVLLFFKGLRIVEMQNVLENTEMFRVICLQGWVHSYCSSFAAKNR